MITTEDQFRIVVQELIKADKMDRLPFISKSLETTMVTPSVPHDNKMFKQEKKHLSVDKIKESWQVYITDLNLSATTIANKYGFESVGPLRKRWIALGIYDPVADFKRNQRFGVKGSPLVRIKAMIPVERLSEIEEQYEKVTVTFSDLMGQEDIDV